MSAFDDTISDTHSKSRPNMTQMKELAAPDEFFTFELMSFEVISVAFYSAEDDWPTFRAGREPNVPCLATWLEYSRDNL
ncbi:hypothetical protein CVT25_002794 [Psilocybe cyanescens]|uniref:Uncharacterized protein n=1 Tax=Psilocybe cyanescens TaxID=93625 RepID=A0A409WKW6_PSICY|nr:hypothetical protein CVT25_002794 [Psilocybe cyanescens]